jgi:hypothetical protein
MMQEFIGGYAIWEGIFCWGSELGIGWLVWKCGYVGEIGGVNERGATSEEKAVLVRCEGRGARGFGEPRALRF